MNKPKYQQLHSIKLEDRFYFNSILVEKLKEKEHSKQKYFAVRTYKDNLKQDYCLL